MRLLRVFFGSPIFQGRMQVVSFAARYLTSESSFGEYETCQRCLLRLEIQITRNTLGFFLVSCGHLAYISGSGSLKIIPRALFEKNRFFYRVAWGYNSEKVKKIINLILTIFKDKNSFWVDLKVQIDYLPSTN